LREFHALQVSVRLRSSVAVTLSAGRKELPAALVIGRVNPPARQAVGADSFEKCSESLVAARGRNRQRLLHIFFDVDIVRMGGTTEQSGE
jgi:hypothetical protein